MTEYCCEEVADKDGILGPCDRLAFGSRLDPEHGEPYPVCRKHHRPPFPGWRSSGEGEGQ